MVLHTKYTKRCLNDFNVHGYAAKPTVVMSEWAAPPQVRKTPSWPRSNVGPTSAFYSCIPRLIISHRNAWANLHLLGQPNTPLAAARRGHVRAAAGGQADGVSGLVMILPPRRLARRYHCVGCTKRVSSVHAARDGAWHRAQPQLLARSPVLPVDSWPQPNGR